MRNTSTISTLLCMLVVAIGMTMGVASVLSFSLSLTRDATAQSETSAPAPTPASSRSQADARDVGAGALSTETLDRRLQGLYARIRCPVCPAQPISESEAPLSIILRNELREQIKDGKSDDEALSWLVQRYGERVLLRPRFRSSAPLWLAPALFALVALLVIRAYTKRRARPPVA